MRHVFFIRGINCWSQTANIDLFDYFIDGKTPLRLGFGQTDLKLWLGEDLVNNMCWGIAFNL